MSLIKIGCLLAGVGLLCCAGCQSHVADENRGLWEQNRELQAQNSTLQQQVAEDEARLKASPDPGQVQEMRDEIARSNAQIQQLQSDLRQPAAGGPAQPGLEGIDASYDARAGTMTVTLPSSILFDSGKATLKNSATATLNKVIVAIRHNYPGKLIYVDGHTDTDPINRTKDQWEDNLDLSAGRAMAVTRYLTAHGIDSKHVVVRAFGSNKPKTTKAASRRVEIVVVTRS